MKKYCIILLLLILCVSGSLYAQGRRASRNAEQMPDLNETKTNERVNFNNRWESLNLTENQKASMDVLRADLRSEIKERTDNLEILQTQKRIAFRNRDFDLLRTYVHEESELNVQVSLLMIDFQEEIDNLLDDEQKVLMRNNFRGFHNNHRQNKPFRRF